VPLQKLFEGVSSQMGDSQSLANFRFREQELQTALTRNRDNDIRRRQEVHRFSKMIHDQQKKCMELDQERSRRTLALEEEILKYRKYKTEIARGMIDESARHWRRRMSDMEAEHNKRMNFYEANNSRMKAKAEESRDATLSEVKGRRDNKRMVRVLKGQIALAKESSRTVTIESGKLIPRNPRDHVEFAIASFTSFCNHIRVATEPIRSRRIRELKSGKAGRVVVVGEKSSGKSSFVEAVFGLRPCYSDKPTTDENRRYESFGRAGTSCCEVFDYAGHSEEEGETYENEDDFRFFASCHVVLLVTVKDPHCCLNKIIYFKSLGCRVIVVRNKIDGMSMVQHGMKRHGVEVLMTPEEPPGASGASYTKSAHCHRHHDHSSQALDGIHSAARCLLSGPIEDSAKYWSDTISDSLLERDGSISFNVNSALYGIIHSCMAGQKREAFSISDRRPLLSHRPSLVKDSISAFEKAGRLESLSSIAPSSVKTNFPHTYSFHNMSYNIDRRISRPICDVRKLSVLIHEATVSFSEDER